MKRSIALLLTASAAVFAAPEPTREELEREIEAQQRILNDWAGLTVYGSDNTEIRVPPTVVFLGDEITESWREQPGGFFKGKPYLNRGIARQTTPQMLVRFRQDVIALKPKVVVIQAGMNDLAGAAGPITEAMAGENFMSMVELAKANGIRVVLASLTPVCDCYRNLTSRRPAGKIIGMNAWLKNYAAQTGAVFLNYYGALVEGRAMRKDLTVDGLIPNEAGYRLMTELAEKAIADALAKPQ